MDASTSWQNLAEMELVFARSRRRAAARHSRSARRAALDRRFVRAVVLAIVLLGFATEGSRVVENAPAKLTASAPKLSRSVAAACGVPAAYASAFRTAARETKLPLSLLAAVAWEESRMNPHARSEAGARGMLQLMPGTAKALAIASADPRANILAGARYLEELVSRFDGNVELALSAYNAGPTAVEKIGRAPSLETLRYAENVEARAALLAAC
ncbi:MAG: lytic transglycosylase domain-containing protein [Actinobacteria bacterium]|nr:MAG: lytic transglycosylase domain-containing protein [Actinomycetota bacterium]